MPTLVANYKNRAAVTQLKKIYSTLSQALAFAVPDGDYTSLTFVNDNMPSMKNWFDTSILPHIKTVNVCYNSSGCWAKETKTLNNSTIPYNRGDIGIGVCIIVFTTADGYTVNLDGYDLNDTQRIFGINTSSNETMVAFVDINGKKAPNVIGKDIFVFVYSNRGLVPAGHDMTDAQVNASCSKTGNGYFCFEKIMRNGWNIDKNNLW